MFPFFLALYNGSQVSIVALWATCFIMALPEPYFEVSFRYQSCPVYIEVSCGNLWAIYSKTKTYSIFLNDNIQFMIYTAAFEKNSR